MCCTEVAVNDEALSVGILAVLLVLVVLLGIATEWWKGNDDQDD